MSDLLPKLRAALLSPKESLTTAMDMGIRLERERLSPLHAELLKAVEMLEKLAHRTQDYAESGCIEGYSADRNSLGDIVDNSFEALASLERVVGGSDE